MSLDDLAITAIDGELESPFDSSPNLVPYSKIDDLFADYAEQRRLIAAVATIFAGPHAGVLEHFLQGNGAYDSRRSARLDAMFKEDGAVRALDAACWKKVIDMTDVYDCMPQARRDEWNTAIAEFKTPAFERDTVVATLDSLLASRERFVAERIDGIFRGLSGSHVTNQPNAFGTRMIIACVASSSIYSTQRAGMINDLRCVIARFLGRPQPHHTSIHRIIDAARRQHGEWLAVDGGVMRLRIYLNGNAHLEVHPDVAWRLNAMLAHLHPSAIPASARQRPPRTLRRFQPINTPLPGSVIDLIAGYRRGNGAHCYTFSTYTYTDDTSRAAAAALQALGAVVDLPRCGPLTARFDYPATDVLDHLIVSGCLPDRRSHQFYPTPHSLAERLVELADIGPTHRCLEPSAGQGALARLMPADRTLCVELSKLHAEILRSQGRTVECADFIAWAHSTPDRFDRIVMNPPFSEGRASAHVQAAATLLSREGRLVAILPAGLRGKRLLGAGWRESWGELIPNAFDNTSIAVSFFTAEREPEHVA